MAHVNNTSLGRARNPRPVETSSRTTRQWSSCGAFRNTSGRINNVRPVERVTSWNPDADSFTSLRRPAPESRTPTSLRKTRAWSGSLSAGSAGLPLEYSVINPSQSAAFGSISSLQHAAQNVVNSVTDEAHAASKHLASWLASCDTQTALYRLLGAAALAAAVASLVAPAHVAAAAFQQSTDAMVQLFTRQTGAAMLNTAGCMWILQEAARRDLLSVDPYRWLNIGVGLQSLLMLVVLAQGGSVGNWGLAGIEGTLGLLGLVTSAAVYHFNGSTQPQLPQPGLWLRQLWHQSRVMVNRRDYPTIGYTAATLLLGIMAAGFWCAAPDAPMAFFQGLAGPLTTCASRTTSGALALAAVTAACLRDAAQREFLHKCTFRVLNGGLAASCAAQAAVMMLALSDGLAAGGVGAAVVAALVAIAGCCTANAMTGSEPAVVTSSTDEEVFRQLAKLQVAQAARRQQRGARPLP